MNGVDHDVILAAIRAGSVTYEQVADLFMASQAGAYSGVSRDHLLVLLHMRMPTQEALAAQMQAYVAALPPEVFNGIDRSRYN